MARMTSCDMVAGTFPRPMTDTLPDAPVGGSTATLGDYDSAVEDAQCPFPRSSKRGKGCGHPVKCKIVEDDASGAPNHDGAAGSSDPAPPMKKEPSKTTLPYPAHENCETPLKKQKTHNFQSPSLSGSSHSLSPPSARKPKNARSKSPTYWRLFSCMLG